MSSTSARHSITVRTPSFLSMTAEGYSPLPVEEAPEEPLTPQEIITRQISREHFRCPKLSCHHGRGDHKTVVEGNLRVQRCRMCRMINAQAEPCREIPFNQDEQLGVTDLTEVADDVEAEFQGGGNAKETKATCCLIM